VKIKFRYADKIPAFLRNKFFLTLIIFILWIVLLDANNLLERYSQVLELRKLRQDREYYLNKIEEDRKKLNELRTDDENLEKFAREQYLMKRKDEDLYIILTPQEDRQNRREND